MPRGSRFFYVIPFLALMANCSRPAPPDHTPRPIAMTRVVRIPAVPDERSAAPQPGADAKLTVSSAGPDDLPQGPDGFDVSDLGLYLITDPIRKRIALFDSGGAYRSEWAVGFRADSVTVLADGSAEVRDASTGVVHLFDQNGKPLESGPAAEPLAARLSGSNGGVIDRPAGVAGGGGALPIRFEKPGMTLLSLQGLATEPNGDTYVALESAAGSDTIEVSKSVRRYSRDSRMLGETTDLPLDYYVRPVNELRAHKGVVYQLMTTESEVRIHVWDMNQNR